MALAALATLTACQQPEEPTAMVNDGTIKFMSAETRATVTTIDNLGTFNVYGYTEGETTLNIFGETTTATKDGTVWKPSVTRYWAEGKTYNFFAVYAPNSDVDKITSKAVDAANDKMTINFTNTTGNVDLVTAASTNVTTLFNKSTGATPLAFQHALARVAFQFNWGCTTGSDQTVEVTDVKLLGTKSTGVLTVAANGDRTWTTSGENVTINYAAPATLTESAKLLPEVDATSGAGYQYIIPTEGLAPQIAFTAVVKDAQGTVLKTFNKSAGVNLPAQAYAAGKSYTFTMNINPQFNDIQFTVTVADWSDGGSSSLDFGNND